MKIRFMALFLSALLSLIILTGCTKDDIEKVDISEMTPEEIFELYETELNDLAAWAIAYEENIRVDLKDGELSAIHLEGVGNPYSTRDLDTEVKQEIKSTMEKLESVRFMANYYFEGFPLAPFCISIRKDVSRGERFYYYPDREILEREKMERDHEEIIDLGDGWYYMCPYVMY